MSFIVLVIIGSLVAVGFTELIFSKHFYVSRLTKTCMVSFVFAFVLLSFSLVQIVFTDSVNEPFQPQP